MASVDIDAGNGKKNQSKSHGDVSMGFQIGDQCAHNVQFIAAKMGVVWLLIMHKVWVLIISGAYLVGWSKCVIVSERNSVQKNIDCYTPLRVNNHCSFDDKHTPELSLFPQRFSYSNLWV